MTAAVARVSNTATQTTQIEQARATADVLAAMEAAKRWPRDEDECERKMRRACQRPLVAERAFWSFPRGKEQLTGPTVDLARTIGAIWRNFQWGISELGRDDGGTAVEGMSTMIAWAWDLETNTRVSTAFLVPHARDTKTYGRQKLTELRDVYENNANQGARRVREMILGLLPDWYVEPAIETCRGVVEGKDEPIEKLRSETGKILVPLGVALPRVLARVGRNDWNETTRGDLATLRIIAKTIQRGEGTVRELFPEPAAPQATANELRGSARTEPTADPQPVPAVVVEPQRSPITDRTRNALFALFGEANLGGDGDRARRLRVCEIFGQPADPLNSSSDLTDEEGRVVEDALRAQGDQVGVYVAQLLADDDAERAADSVAGES